jgi:spore coat protein H
MRAWLVFVAALAVGCRGGGEGPAGPSLMEGWGNATVLGGGGVLHYSFAIDEGLLTALPDTAGQERYLPADLVVSGQAVGQVGLRYYIPDGNFACFDNGVAVCPKISLKVRFDFIDLDNRLDGLKRLILRAETDDPSQLRERLNAKLFQDMGVHAAKVAHAFVSINGRRQGLFTVVEDVDDRFVQARWPAAGTGNLYKDAWPVEVEPDAYQLALLTNQARPDHMRMVAFAQALRSSPADQIPAVLDRFAGIDYFMRFMAVNDAINNYDGVTAFYCDQFGRDCSNRNFFWYQSQTDDKFWLIPGETDGALQYHTPLEPVPPWNQAPADCNQRMTVEDALMMPPACDAIFRAAVAAGRPAYVAALDRLLRVWNVDDLHQAVDGWAAEIADAVALDPAGPGPAGFRAGLSALRRDLGVFRDRLQALRDGARVAPFGLAPDGLTDFEGLAPLPVMLGMTSDANPHSGVVHNLNGDAPLSGAADVRLDFELANESEDARLSGFEQWVRWRLPLDRPASLGGFNRIRLRIKPDSIRNVRFDVDSPRYPDGDESPRYGWTLLVPPRATEIVLERSNLRLPDGWGQGPVSADEVLEQVSALVVTPEPRGRKGDGLFPAGKTDTGYLQIDDVVIE